PHPNEQNDISDYKTNFTYHLRPHHKYIKQQPTKNPEPIKLRGTNTTIFSLTPNKPQVNITNAINDTSNPIQSKKIRIQIAEK
ncbi:3717_t:CDS:1, partial [Gigaspora margarita]